MFVAIARFPEIPTEREEEFQAWFAWSNDQLREIDGLKGRRLLRAPDGTYMALVEHKTSETFDAMHATEAASRRARPTRRRHHRRAAGHEVRGRRGLRQVRGLLRWWRRPWRSGRA